MFKCSSKTLNIPLLLGVFWPVGRGPLLDAKFTLYIVFPCSIFFASLHFMGLSASSLRDHSRILHWLLLQSYWYSNLYMRFWGSHDDDTADCSDGQYAVTLPEYMLGKTILIWSICTIRRKWLEMTDLILSVDTHVFLCVAVRRLKLRN